MAISHQPKSNFHQFVDSSPLLGGSYEPPKPVAVQVQEAYEEGASDIEICEIMKMTHGKFRTLYESNPDFRTAVDLGRVMSQAWWMRTGRKNLKDKTFNVPLWAFNMKNRYGWAEKTENTNQDTAELTTAQMAEKLSKLLPNTLARLHPEKTQQELLAIPNTVEDSET